MSREELAPTRKAIELVNDVVVDTVKEAGPTGAPAGPMYLAFAQAGWSLEAFERMMTALVESGRLTKRGHCYFAAPTEH